MFLLVSGSSINIPVHLLTTDFFYFNNFPRMYEFHLLIAISIMFYSILYEEEFYILQKNINNSLFKFLVIIFTFFNNTVLIKIVYLFIIYLLSFLIKIIYYSWKTKNLFITFFNKNLSLEVWKPIFKKTSYYEYYRAAKVKYDEIRFSDDFDNDEK